jgi:hypothetical protein
MYITISGQSKTVKDLTNKLGSELLKAKLVMVKSLKTPNPKYK